jgi:hypothetical protein
MGLPSLRFNLLITLQLRAGLFQSRGNAFFLTFNTDKEQMMSRFDTAVKSMRQGKPIPGSLTGFLDQVYQTVPVGHERTSTPDVTLNELIAEKKLSKTEVAEMIAVDVAYKKMSPEVAASLIESLPGAKLARYLGSTFAVMYGGAGRGHRHGLLVPGRGNARDAL